MEPIKAEQYAAAQRQASVAAQTAYAWWLELNPGATKSEIITEAERLIEVFGTVEAQIACVFYMNQRRAAGINDGWRILPSDGYPLERVRRWLETAYDDAAPDLGLRQTIDQTVKAYGRRTIARGRGTFDES